MGSMNPPKIITNVEKIQLALMEQEMGYAPTGAYTLSRRGRICTWHLKKKKT